MKLKFQTREAKLTSDFEAKIEKLQSDLAEEKEKTSIQRREIEETKNSQRWTKQEFMREIGKSFGMRAFIKETFEIFLDEGRLKYKKLIGDKAYIKTEKDKIELANSFLFIDQVH